MMAGKRQHFIPRFLQEGFASHTTEAAAFTWVYRKGSRPFNANIINVGVEGRFYTEEGDTQVDDLITDAEELFSALVHTLRTSTAAPTSDPDIPRLIAHLEVRTRHLRESFLRTGDSLVSKLLDFIADEQAFIAYLERQFRKDPSILRDSMAKELARQGLPQVLLQRFEQLADPILPALMAQVKAMLPKFAEALRVTLPKTLKNAAKSGHIRALKKTIAPELKVERYENLAYSVVEAADGSLLLGDSAILFRVRGSRSYKSFLSMDDVVCCVILPLSSRRALVGARERVDVLPPDLPRAIARCSLEYFIAAERSEVKSVLRDEIGEDAGLLTRGEIEEIVGQLMKE